VVDLIGWSVAGCGCRIAIRTVASPQAVEATAAALFNRRLYHHLNSPFKKGRNN